MAVPAETPVTTPMDAPTEATPGVLQLQTPPIVESESVIVLPVHIAVGPSIGVNASAFCTYIPRNVIIIKANKR